MKKNYENIKRVLVFSAHADDCEFFAGGTVAWLANHGAEITEVIATDNGRGSFELDSTMLVKESREIEAKEAAKILGKKDIHFLGFPDGFLDDTPKNELRRIFMRFVREIKPDLVMSFDPHAPFETHPDHIHVARAAIEATGFASFPLYHKEQLEEGLETHTVAHYLWFAKNDREANYTHDISSTIEQKIESLIAHKSQIRMMMTDIKNSLKATGKRPDLIPLLDEDNFKPALTMLIKAWAESNGEKAGLKYGEAFRAESAGDFLDVAT